MKTNLVRVAAVAFLMTMASGQVMASNSNNDPEDDFVIIPATQAATVPADAEKTYEDRAKELGAKIVDGFKATSPWSGLTNFIASGTAVYAKFVLGAESITEGYLQMGKGSLDLNDLKAVYKHCVDTFHGRITDNVQKGASYLGGPTSYAGTAAQYGGNFYYDKRLAAALNWVYLQDATKYADPELPVSDNEVSPENSGKTSPIQNNNNNNNNNNNDN